MTAHDVSRRGVLTALGAGVSVATLGGGMRSSSAPYTQYTYLDGTTLADTTPNTTEESNGISVRLAWYETYNETLLATQNGTDETNASAVLDPARAPAYVNDAAGPIVSLSNVLPDDTGRVAIGISVESLPEGVDGAALWYRLTLTSDEENGINEPERKTGDVAADGGELGGSLDVTVWEDTGVVGGIGGCNGRLDAGELPRWSGSLVAIDDALSNGVRLGSDDCLAEGSTRCLGLRWGLPGDVGNVVQSDSVEFDVEIVATDCGAPNPFAGTEVDE
jgi:hypothetical protein